MMGLGSGNTFGELTDAKEDTIINKIFDFVSSILTRVVAGKDENENAITSRLCKALSAMKPSEFPFFFQHQNIESAIASTSTDFAVFQTIAYAEDHEVFDDEVFVSLVKFEAKRLSSALASNREKEYVHGEYAGGKCVKNSGAIERFKNGRHGMDVFHVGIIGYVQTDSPGYWLEKVNSWIREQIHSSYDKALVWRSEDLLVPEYATGSLSCYNSISKRVKGDEVKIKHFWVNFLGI